MPASTLWSPVLLYVITVVLLIAIMFLVISFAVTSDVSVAAGDIEQGCTVKASTSESCSSGGLGQIASAFSPTDFIIIHKKLNENDFCDSFRALCAVNSKMSGASSSGDNAPPPYSVKSMSLMSDDFEKIRSLINKEGKLFHSHTVHSSSFIKDHCSPKKLSELFESVKNTPGPPL